MTLKLTKKNLSPCLNKELLHDKKINIRIEPIFTLTLKNTFKIYGFELLFTKKYGERTLNGYSVEEFFKKISPKEDFQIFLEHLKNLVMLHEKICKLFCKKKHCSKVFFINLTAKTWISFNIEILERCQKIFEKTGFSINIEITEFQNLLKEEKKKFLQVYFQNKEKEKRRLKENIINISIDDFGKGFSNFELVNHLKPEYVKIDLSYIPPRLATDIAFYFIQNYLVKKGIIFEKIETIEQLNEILACFPFHFKSSHFKTFSHIKLPFFFQGFLFYR